MGCTLWNRISGTYGSLLSKNWNRSDPETDYRRSGACKSYRKYVIRDLKNRSLVILEPGRHDKREKLVFLTEKGKQYADGIINPLLAAEERISRKIGDERMKQTIETMELFNLLFEKELKESERKHE